MKDKSHSFNDYMNNSKKLFKMLFGDKLYKKLNSIPLKTIEWDGIDIDCTGITATFPNIKERFSENWIDYFSDSEMTLLDLYLQVIFHYGYQQCHDMNYVGWEQLNDLIEKLTKEKE